MSDETLSDKAKETDDPILKCIIIQFKVFSAIFPSLFSRGNGARIRTCTNYTCLSTAVWILKRLFHAPRQICSVCLFNPRVYASDGNYRYNLVTAATAPFSRVLKCGCGGGIMPCRMKVQKCKHAHSFSRRFWGMCSHIIACTASALERKRW